MTLMEEAASDKAREGMVSEDTLKKLLDDFVEKEALIKEEIQVVADEITQLEVRLEGCRQRLSTLSSDRDKVLTMRGRYADGNFKTAVEPALAASSAVSSPPAISGAALSDELPVP